MSKVQRKIIGFHTDEAQDWVAELDCFHRQHTRNNPPFINRPWVETKAGRSAKIGTALDCVHCDHLVFPDRMNAYKRTPDFTETTVPKGLLKDHSTKTGAWGIIHVLQGRLIYTVNYPETKEYIISQGQTAVVVPCMLHKVQPEGTTRFYVEFYSKTD